MVELASEVAIKGHMHLQLFNAWNEDGTRVRDSRGRFSRRLKDERIIKNTVTELGDRYTADAMSDQGDGTIDFMSVGTGTGQGAADTGLAAVLDRNALDSTTQGAGVADNDVIYVCTWAAGDGTGAITEAGIFKDDDDVTMAVVASFAVINKAAGDSLVITWTLTFGAS